MSRFLPLFLFCIAVFEVGIYFYWQQMTVSDSVGIGSSPLFDPTFVLVIGAVNIVLIAAREWASYLYPWFQGNWVNRIFVFFTLLIITMSLAYLYMVKDMPLSPVPMNSVMICLISMYVICAFGASYYYTKVSPDMINLTSLMVSLVVLGSVLCVKIIYQFNLPQNLELLLLGLMVVAQISAATSWLLRAAKREAL